MSADPFKIIGINEEPPKDLRKEVMGSVRLAVLAMRITQLFVADYSAALFDKFKLLPGPTDDSPDPKDQKPE